MYVISQENNIIAKKNNKDDVLRVVQSTTRLRTDWRPENTTRRSLVHTLLQLAREDFISWGVASLLEDKSWVGLCLVQLYAKYKQGRTALRPYNHC